MHQPLSKRHPLSSALAAILTAGLLSPPTQAATRIWDGNGLNDNWGYVENLGPLIPGNTNWTDNTVFFNPLPFPGDTLVFQGAGRLNPNNDFANLTIAGISFAAGAGQFTLGGNAITSVGLITNSSGNLQTINLPISIGADQTWNGGAAGMAIKGLVTLGNHTLTLQNHTGILNSGADFSVGDSGAASLTLGSGSTLSNFVGWIGKNSGSVGTATVTGANSLWTNRGDLLVGNTGSGTLVIQDGGRVSNAIGYLSTNSGSAGTATVTGANSLWANGDNLYVGNAGGGTLVIQSGGQVSNSGGYLGINPGSTGTATVTGADSLWANSGDLFVGYSGSGTLVIQDGGRVSNGIGWLGTHPGSAGTATVTGANSLWASSENLYVGYSGSGTLDIQSGGRVSNGFGYLGFQAGRAGTATVTGANSLWANSADLTVGYSGSGALDIQSGGQVSNDFGWLGANTGGAGTATVTGANSLWASSGDLTVGDSGSGTLNIQSGGKVSNAYGYLGDKSGSTGTATVNGANSLWASSGHLYVGYSGTGTLNIQSGGKVTNTNGFLGNFGTGAATVDGADSLWASNGSLYVGYAGGGTLNIKDGGQVSNSNGFLGYFVGSTGTATVTGADALWANTGNLTVGHEGAGTLNILSGGAVTVDGSLSINGLSSLNLKGGSLTAATLSLATGGQFNWTTGTLTLNSTQTLTADGGLSGLSLNTGKVLHVGGTLNINDYAALSLNGGQLAATRLDVASAGSFDWQKGKLELGSLSLGPSNGAFGDYLKLDSAKPLAVTGDLAVSASSTLDVGGGASTSIGHNLDVNGVLALGAGRIAVANQAIVENGGSVTLANAATSRLAATAGIVNRGDITGSGRLEGNVDNQAGGRLLLNNDHVTVAGSLENEANASIEGRGVLSADSLHNAGLMAFSGGQTDLYGNVSMSGGQGRIVNSGGGVLTFYNNVVHNGQAIQTGSGATTVFIGNVSGAGGFTGTGQTLFEGGYNPGNSPAAVDFHGGNASFDTDSVLTMEIFGATPGTEYDRLFNINTLSFNGNLNLVFGNGYTPTAGQSFDLLGYAVFSGAFDPLKISVTGFDRSLLDFSRLAVDGKLGVTAAPVPLPPAVWLFSSALAGLTVFGRRRRASRPGNAY